MDSQGSRGSFGGMSGADSNGIAVSGGARGGRASTGLDGPAAVGGNDGIQMGTQAPEVVICWESARPVLEAKKIELPSSFADHFAVSITGVPSQMLRAALSGGVPKDPQAQQKAALDRLLAGTTLTTRGRPPVAAEFFVQLPERQSLIFAFRKQNLPLTANDKDVIFAMNLRLIAVKAKFELKDMEYRGTLAI
jgi:hypothetical protein